MLEKQDDRRDRDLASHSCHQLAIDDRGPNVLETARNSHEDLDRVLSRFTLVVPAVEPRRDREDDDDEGVSKHRYEEEESF